MGQVDTKPKTGFCECAELFNAAEPDRERCLIVCGAEIPAKHVKCRPCALGNHTGLPCEQYVREGVFHFAATRDCAGCGFDGALHKRGSDGSLNGL